MKKLLFLFVLGPLFMVKAQHDETKMGPIIKDYGAVFQIEKPELMFTKDKTYKVIFDVYTDDSKKKALNPMIITAARYLNMHAQQGVPVEHLKVAMVFHGAATKSALSNEAYLKHYGTDNPNNDLLIALKKARVELYVCGQSYLAHKYQRNEKNSSVKLALSALTTLVEYQTNGYELINFN